METGGTTFTLWADIGCPWAHVAVFRWRLERARRHLQESVHLDVRSFPLELINSQATPKRILDAEIPVAGSLAPEAGWEMWQRQTYDYAVSTLLAMEAVQAAKTQGPKASEDLDAALRLAFFGASRNISLHHEIVEIAGTMLGGGRAGRRSGSGTRQRASHDLQRHGRGGEPDDPGQPPLLCGRRQLAQSRCGEGLGRQEGKGFPVIESDDPDVYGQMFDRIERTNKNGKDQRSSRRSRG